MKSHKRPTIENLIVASDWRTALAFCVFEHKSWPQANGLGVERKVKTMMDFNNAVVACFGKIIFVPKNHTIPALPDMNMIVFKKESVYQAICINIEIDAVGKNMKESCENLKQALYIYISQMVDNYENNVKAAVEDIVNVAYSQGELKSLLFTRYLQAKRLYLIDKIAKENKAKSRREELINVCKNIFQVEPIRFNLTPVAGFA